MIQKFLLAALLAAAPLTTHAADANRDTQRALAGLDALFEKFMREQHVPGLVYGVVVNGQPVLVRSFGVANVADGTAVTPDTAFRIASMSKQFTALATLRLRDAGKLSLDSPAEKYIPELGKLRYPTSDSPKITVRDLMSHASGFVTDDPWGDRQLAMNEADFTKLITRGVPFSRAPGMAYEYSNYGFALVGRVVSNLARTNYSNYITESFLRPLGMTNSGWDFAAIPAARRAQGYRWENDGWLEEPVLGPGEFGAMGGLITTANDYARYVAWLLNAWPPRDGPEDALLKRSSVREITRPANYAIVQPPVEPTGCARSASYGYGVIPFSDCILGFHFGHSGGLPGYGSNVLFMPDRGVAVFAFANRTYAPASRAVRDAANALVQSGAFPPRPTPLSPALADIARTVERIYESGDVLTARGQFAPNVLMDQGAPLRNARIAELKKELGACKLADNQGSDSAMSATLGYDCDRGKLKVKVILAPTVPATVQSLQFNP
jgi:D-alanyl-D-alanine-carboxypeptidase/D-alanyl-D-alanine-endopeptidase